MPDEPPRWLPLADLSTVRGSEPRIESIPLAPWLTVLWHPDSQRIGEVAPLPPKLSRLEPDFGPPGLSALGPLGDAHVSRKVATFTALPDGRVRVAADPLAEVVVDGRPLATATELGTDELLRGVVIELARHVALLLQLRRPPTTVPASSLVGASDAITKLRTEIGRVADTVIPVLIVGETGVGKEHVARALHDGSRRAAKPFVAVNMATVAPSVAAAQLFGHARGAFTGAEHAHVGLFEQADGGTLFLDEIADAPAEVQAMLLRVLETGELQPLGAASSRKIDVRVLAASDADLEADSLAGEFRPQLYHRLAGYRISVPTLRARADDLGRLLVTFLARELAAAGASSRLGPSDPGEPSWLPTTAFPSYARHAWPGNVRELANLARHLAVVGRDHTISLEEAIAPLGPQNIKVPAAPATPTAPRTIDDDALIAALAANRWKTGAAATALGISRTTLYALIDRCPRIRKARDLEREEILACQASAHEDLDAMAEQLRVSKRGLQLRMRELGLS